MHLTPKKRGKKKKIVDNNKDNSHSVVHIGIVEFMRVVIPFSYLFNILIVPPEPHASKMNPVVSPNPVPSSDATTGTLSLKAALFAALG